MERERRKGKKKQEKKKDSACRCTKHPVKDAVARHVPCNSSNSSSSSLSVKSVTRICFNSLSPSLSLSPHPDLMPRNKANARDREQARAIARPKAQQHCARHLSQSLDVGFKKRGLTFDSSIAKKKEGESESERNARRQHRERPEEIVKRVCNNSALTHGPATETERE